MTCSLCDKVVFLCTSVLGPYHRGDMSTSVFQPGEGLAIPMDQGHLGSLCDGAHIMNAHIHRGILASHSSYSGTGFVLKQIKILDYLKVK